MVRLEANQLSVTVANIITFQFLVVRLEENLWTEVSALEKFQFLVVRLEDFSHERNTEHKWISIPCGAIRSCTVNHHSATFFNFNSLWCD